MDNIFTIDLPGSDLVFTQYLYVKEEVRIALLVSILNKSDDAIFWAYELYYSGFKYELLNLIWKIYFDFFATLNPEYEIYLLKKHNELIMDKDMKLNNIVSSIINDIIFRPFNCDIFMLRNLCENFEIEIIYHHGTKIINMYDLRYNFKHWIHNTDFRSIAQWILNINKNLIKIEDIYYIFLDIFKELKLITTKQKDKLLKEFNIGITINVNVKIEVILLSKILGLFSNKAKPTKFYFNIEPSDIVFYDPIIGTNEIKHYRILKQAYISHIDNFKHLSLFKLTRNKYNLQEKYWYNWEYHASFSPVWSDRINKFGGYINYIKQKVTFKEEPNDDLKQEFYRLYGLEPDEQQINVQNKSIGTIEKKYNWKWFYEQYIQNGLFKVYEEEFEEFDIDGLSY